MDTRCTCWHRTGSQATSKVWTDSMLNNRPNYGTPFPEPGAIGHFQEALDLA